MANCQGLHTNEGLWARFRTGSSMSLTLIQTYYHLGRLGRACHDLANVRVQVEVTEPEAYMYDGEYEKKAEELHHPDLITIRQSTVSPPDHLAALSLDRFVLHEEGACCRKGRVLMPVADINIIAIHPRSSKSEL